MAADARRIAGLAPMGVLLGALGLIVNERTRRCACLIHGGLNPTAFTWTDGGLWKCHSCGQGGDKISLVRAVRKCSFPDALKFLAALAGVEIRAGKVSREEILHEMREREALRNDAQTLATANGEAWNQTRDTVLRLEGIRRDAGRRLREISQGKAERFSSESEWCWAALAEISRQVPSAAASYAIASFGGFEDRLRFALDGKAAEQAVAAALDCGYVADERGRRFEVVL